MTPDSLKKLCNDINSGMSPRWKRNLAVAYQRCKNGQKSCYADFTLREKIYIWTGI